MACHLFKDSRKVKSTLISSEAWKCYEIFLWLKSESLFRCLKRNEVVKEKMTREEGRSMLTKCFAEIYNTELRATTAALCSTHLPLFTSWKCNEMKLFKVNS